MTRKKKDGRGRPGKPDHRQKNIYIHGAVLDAVDGLARDESRTFSAQIEVLLRRALAESGIHVPGP